MSKVKKIPKTKIDEGIGISLKKSLQHLDGAEVLVRQNLLNDAVALIEFAIEEFGRSVYLKERLNSGLEDVEKSLETSHWLKYDKAFSVLPEKLKTIWESTISPQFPPQYFPKGYFPITKETISPLTRLNAIFPYFDENSQTWHDGIAVDRNKLLEIIEELRENIRNF
jgi:hypothetical protein